MNKLVFIAVLTVAGTATAQTRVCDQYGCRWVFPNQQIYQPAQPVRNVVRATTQAVRTLTAPVVTRRVVVGAPNVTYFTGGCGCANCDGVNCTCIQSVVSAPAITTTPVTYVTYSSSPVTTSYTTATYSNSRGFFRRLFSRWRSRRAMRFSGWSMY